MNPEERHLRRLMEGASDRDLRDALDAVPPVGRRGPFDREEFDGRIRLVVDGREVGYVRVEWIEGELEGRARRREIAESEGRQEHETWLRFNRPGRSDR